MGGGTMHERRRCARSTFPSRLRVSLLEPRRAVPASGVNISPGGLCLQLREMLDVRSLVRLEVAPRAIPHSALAERRGIECTGRVAWVIQRLDLRDAPPFLFDVGIEFLEPARIFQRLHLAPTPRRALALTRRDLVGSVTIRGRSYVPRLERDVHPAKAGWHLVVSVDGTPCFSGRYPTARHAITAWEQFQRQQVKRARSG